MRILIAVLVGALTAYLLFPTIFKSREECIDCVRYWFMAWFPFDRGQFGRDDRPGEFKLFFWLLGSIGMGCGTYFFL